MRKGEILILLTILICVHNGQEFLGSAIDSLVSQSIKDLELLIVNDASTDKTEKIIDSFKGNEKVLVTCHKNKDKLGLAKSREIGINMACGEYLTILDADDIIVPNSLNIICDNLKKIKPDICISTSEAYFMDGSKKVFNAAKYYRKVPAGRQKEYAFPLTSNDFLELYANDEDFFENISMDLSTKFVRTELLKDSKILKQLFSLHYGSDFLRFLELSLKAKDYLLLDSPFYIWKCNSSIDNASNSKFRKTSTLDDASIIYKYWKRWQ
ncbi:MAG: glycosyltransferase family 2 protein, partial [Enterococcus sp.]|nr:glycosyltransferase family 2 protein [Enterococcus sp.]